MPTVDQLATNVFLPLLCVSLVMGFIRLWRGPSLPDRVIALDFLSIVVMGMMIVHGIGTGEESFLDVAIVVSLLSFLTAVAFSYYLEKRASE